MADDGEEDGWTWAPRTPRAARARGPLVPWLLALLLLIGAVAGIVVQTARVNGLSAALQQAHATATAQAEEVTAARSGAAATATAITRALRRPPIALPLPPAVARPACTAVARAQDAVRLLLRGVKGAETVIDSAARALQEACGAAGG